MQGAYHTAPQLRQRIAAQFLDVMVDWAAVDRALALGPPSAAPPTVVQQQWADTAHALSMWAEATADAEDRCRLRAAVEVLTRWQSIR